LNYSGPAPVSSRIGRELILAGVDLPVLFPMPADGDWGYEKTIAAMAGKIT